MTSGKKDESSQEEKSRITLGDVVQKKKRQNKIPVFIGDMNNTIIFISADRDPEEAKQNFLQRLDQYNPAKSEEIVTEEDPTPKPKYVPPPQNKSGTSSEFSPFKF